MKGIRTWSAHGLIIRCDDVDLDARMHTTASATPDVVIEVLPAGEVPAYGDMLPGTVLAHVDHGEGSALTVAQSEGVASIGPPVVNVCFHGVATAAIDRETSRVRLRLAPHVDPALASVLISGTLLSVVLTLRGHPVMHASAVVVGEGDEQVAVGIVGRSGMGKSTMATLLCRDGAKLLADDVLRTDLLADGSVRAWPGATATRLRPAAEALAKDTGIRVTTTSDGRYATNLALAPAGAVPLVALVVPGPDREADHVQMRALGSVEALIALLSFPRLLGWSDLATSGVAHHHWGELARRVPVVSARVPWGPPFAPGLGADLLAGIEAVRRQY